MPTISPPNATSVSSVFARTRHSSQVFLAASRQHAHPPTNNVGSPDVVDTCADTEHDFQRLSKLLNNFVIRKPTKETKSRRLNNEASIADNHCSVNVKLPSAAACSGSSSVASSATGASSASSATSAATAATGAASSAVSHASTSGTSATSSVGATGGTATGGPNLACMIRL